MADPLAKVRMGDPLRIPAAAYNAFVDAAKSARGLRQDTARDATREQSAFLTPVKNDSGAVVPRFGILGVAAPLFDPGDAPEAFRRRAAVAGVTPTEQDHLGRFVVALEPIAPGAIGVACGAGLCAAQVDFPADGRERRCADVANGSSVKLRASDRGAATIIWKEAGTGVKWAIVRLGGESGLRLFPVVLSVSSGFQGSALQPPTWHYDVADAISGVVLAFAVNPTAAPHAWRRPAVGILTPATFGTAHFDDDGILVLDWINEVSESRWAFPVILEQTGGAQGTPSAAATWTYSVTDATRLVTVGTDVDPAASPHEWRRPPAGKVTPATFGYASLSAGGVLTVGWINELPEMPPTPVFPVALTLNTESYGDASTQTAHTYDITDAATGVPLPGGTNQNPGLAPHHFRRPNVGRMLPATQGLAFLDEDDGSDRIIVSSCNEADDRAGCAE